MPRESQFPSFENPKSAQSDSTYSENALELGTGTGLATAWLLDGMDEGSSLISVDNDKAASGVALRHLGHDGRLRLVVEDGNEWLANNSNC